MHLVSLIKRALTVSEVHAHCDIPCGIYDPIAAKIAAQTVQKMVMRIEALDAAACDASSETPLAATWLLRRSTHSTSRTK